MAELSNIPGLFIILGAIGSPMTEEGQKHPFFSLLIVGLIILVGGIIGYFGLKKHLKQDPFQHSKK